VTAPATHGTTATALRTGPAIDLSRANPDGNLATTLIGAPVRSARAWATALAPNKRGGWNFITQTYELPSPSPTEWVVVDLDTGTQTVDEGPTGLPSNFMFEAHNEIRAKNGRIFFPGLKTQLAYYDPVDEHVKQLGKVVDPSGSEQTIYRLQFGPDGMLYGTTQSTDLPVVFQLDPETLQHRILGRVGKDRLTYSFGYFLAADPPWVYVAVGEHPWELAAINIKTGETRILAKRGNEAFMHLEPRKEGVLAKLVSDYKTPRERDEYVWCVDGKTYPYDPSVDAAHLPFKPRDTRVPKFAPPGLPEIDTSSLDADSNGVGRVFWRPDGSAGPWRERDFKVSHTSEVTLESLVALDDHTLLGNAKQYHGFFELDTRTHALTFFGAHGPSRGPRTLFQGLLYIAGYPKAQLYVYDPKHPWTATRLDEDPAKASPTANPKRLGNFRESGTHYAYWLVPSSNGRLYYAGRRERDGIGSGLGFYDIKANRFAGFHEGLSFFDPRGLAVVDALHEIVFSGGVHGDPALPGKAPADAELIVYDDDLNEQGRYPVKPGLANTGMLFKTAEPTTIAGVIRPDPLAPPKRAEAPGDGGPPTDAAPEPTGADSLTAAYLFDLKSKRLVRWVDLSGPITAWTQRDDDLSVWLVLDQRLVRIDTSTLAVTVLGKFADVHGEITHMAWAGTSLFITAGSEVRQVVWPP